MAFDLTVNDEEGRPWDFDVASQREKAWKIVVEQKPTLLVGTPMCTAFCTWQNINGLKRSPDEIRRLRARAMVHLEFCARLYRLQLEEGRYFLHEHPMTSRSWQEPCIRSLLELGQVDRVVCDQCQMGSTDDRTNRPVRKPTYFMSNSDCILRALERRCKGKRGECSRPGGGQHVMCSGAVARRAALFTVTLCRTSLDGFRDQLAHGRRLSQDSVGISCL